MKKTIAIIGVILFLSAGTAISYKNVDTIVKTNNQEYYSLPEASDFNNEVLYKCVIDEYNKNHADSEKDTSYKLTQDELESITTLTCEGSTKGGKITSLKGLEKLTNLTDLKLYYIDNEETIDLTALTKLKNVDINLALKAKEIKFYEEKQIEKIKLYNISNLTSLDLTKLPNLKTATLSLTGLTSFTQNSVVENLVLSGTKLDAVDLSQLTNLKTLDIYANYNMTDITLPTLNNIEYFRLTGQKTTTNLSFQNPEQEVPSLKTFIISGTSVNPNIDFTKYPNLEELTLQYTSINRNIDLSKCTNIKKVDLTDSDITGEININSSALTSLLGSDNQITGVTLTNTENLKTINLNKNKISKIDLTSSPALTELNLSDNALTSLDVSQNKNLNKTNINNNPFKGQDIIVYKNTNADLTNKLVETETNKLNIVKQSENKLNRLFSVNSNNIQLTPTTKSEEFNKNNYNTINKVTANLNTKGDYTLTATYAHELTNNEKIDNNSYKYTASFNVSVIELTSDTYNVDEENEVINIGHDELNDEILEKLTLSTEKDGLTVKREDNKVVIKYNEETLKSFDIINYTSDTYDLSKDYIYVGTEEFDESKITVSNCEKTYDEAQKELTIKHNGKTVKTIKIIDVKYTDYTGDSSYVYIVTDTLVTKELKSDTNQIELKYNEETIATLDIVKISSSDYKLTNDYVYTFIETIEPTKITVTNGTNEVSDNTLTIKHNETVITSLDIITLSSTDYQIKDKYIYVGKKTGDYDTSKIDTKTTNKVTLETEENNLTIKYNDELIDEIPIISYTSEKYDLSNEYIDYGTSEFTYDGIEVTNGELYYTDGILSLKAKDGTVLETTKILTYTSSHYHLTNDYIYLGTSNFDESLINLTNVTLDTQEKGKLKIKYNDTIIKTYDLLEIKFSSDIEVSNELINIDKIPGDLNYEDFMSKIEEKSNDLTITIYKGDQKIESGKMEHGMHLVVTYKDTDTELERFTISDYYLEFNEELDMDTLNHEITFHKLTNNNAITIEELLTKITTNGTVKVLKNGETEKDRTESIATGDKIQITLGEDETIYYTAIVKGDINGSGSVTSSDLQKLLDKLAGKITLTELEEKAIDLNNSNSLTSSDLSKLLDFLAGKIGGDEL